uniref:hypothetical protein n=1 Tax=Enterobacter roggenkampii TaxID=1812935 RepID=UPI003D6E8E7B
MGELFKLNSPNLENTNYAPHNTEHGSGSGGGDDMLQRVKELETKVATLVTDVAIIKDKLASKETLYTILCKCLFSEVTVQAVTELDNKAAHCHTPVPQR